MEVVATRIALVLKFDDLEDLETVAKHLTEQAEGIKNGPGLKPPYLYSVYDNRIESDEVADLLVKIKGA